MWVPQQSFFNKMVQKMNFPSVYILKIQKLHMKRFCMARASLTQNSSSFLSPTQPFSSHLSPLCALLAFWHFLNPALTTLPRCYLHALIYSCLGQFLSPGLSVIFGVFRNAHILLPNLPSCCPWSSWKKKNHPAVPGVGHIASLDAY